MYGPVVDLTFHLIEYDSNTVLITGSLLLVSSYWFYKTTIKQPRLKWHVTVWNFKTEYFTYMYNDCAVY